MDPNLSETLDISGGYASKHVWGFVFVAESKQEFCVPKLKEHWRVRVCWQKGRMGMCVCVCVCVRPVPTCL